jgi:hypothetical protein
LVDEPKPSYTLFQGVPDIDEAQWRSRVLNRLYEAGLLREESREKGPVSALFMMKDDKGNRIVHFTLRVPSGMKRIVDAAFKPHKSRRVHSELLFRIPAEFLE